MRTCLQCFVPCFGGLLGPHFNTLDLFTSLSIHLVGFLHVGLIYLISSSVFSEGVAESLLLGGGHGPCRGLWCVGQTWLCRQETLAAGPGDLGLCFLSVKPRAGEQMRQRWQRCRLPRAAIVQPTVFSAACAVAVRSGPCRPSEPLL